jgi:hypothetical protein
MARKSVTRTRASVGAKRPPISSSTRLRMPRSWRVVTARKLIASKGEKPERTARRDVPEIRLSGAWLARVGFPKGRRYLISADAAFETIYLQADAPDAEQRRRR